jgi:hypothetical protein
MNKLLSPLLFLFLLASPVFGQLGVGLKGGFGGSATSQEMVNGMSRSLGSAPTFGLMVNYDLDLHFAGQLEFNYTTFSETIRYGSTFFPLTVSAPTAADSQATTKPKINYLQIPIQGRVTFGEKKFKTFLTFGTYVGIGMSGTWFNGPQSFSGDYILFNQDTDVQFSKGDIRKLDVGGLAGFGAQYALGKAGTLFAEARVQLGFIDIYNPSPDQRKGFTALKNKYLTPTGSWRTANITVGYFHTFKLPKKKSNNPAKKAGKQKRR